MFDSHLYLPLSEDTIARAKAAGVVRLSVCATHEGDWADVLVAAQAHPDLIIPSIGVHPWWVNSVKDGWVERLRDTLVANPSAHIGETGLDKLKAKRTTSEHRVRNSVGYWLMFQFLLRVLAPLRPFDHGLPGGRRRQT